MFFWGLTYVIGGVLVFEMTEAGGHHGHVVSIAVFDGIVVAYGASGVYHGCDAGFVGYLHTVSKWEEGIRSHHCAVEVVAERLSLGYGLAQSVHTRCLADAAC